MILSICVWVPTWIINQIASGKYGKLPGFEELENPNSALASEVYTADGILLGKYYYENRSNVSYDNLSPNLINALIATEDSRFKEHSGIDVKGLFRVLFKTVLMGNTSSGGGSTISQQLAKNLFKREKFGTLKEKVIQKLKEWIIAVKLEKAYTKEEIITMYFNTVPFGNNAFGIKSACKTFFSSSTDTIGVEDAAVLVGMLKANTKYNPKRNPELSKQRRNIVLSQMVKYKYLKKEKYDSLKEGDIILHFSKSSHNEGLAPYFREYLRLELMKWCKNNYKPDGTNYDIYKDGLKIYTTLNSKMQLAAEAAVSKHMPELQEHFNDAWKNDKPWSKDPTFIKNKIARSERYKSLKERKVNIDSINKIFRTPVQMTVFTWQGEKDTTMSPLDSIKYYAYFLHAGFMAMDPYTGYIKAWVGGINHKYFKFDHVNINAKRQVGSTFKPFVYTAGIDNSVITPCYKLANTPITFEDFNWTPKNADEKYSGQMMSIQKGLALSENIIAARVMYLLGQKGPKHVVDLAKRMGIVSYLPEVPAICLGTPDISVFEMVGAYSTFPNKGFASTPLTLTKIEDKNGNIIQQFSPRNQEAVSEQTAYVMVKMLENVVKHGTGLSIRYKYKLMNQICGKTGTTQNQSDGWYMGFVPKLVAGCWVGGNDRIIRFKTIEYGQGARMALPIWAEFMQRVYQDSTSLGIAPSDVFETPEKKIPYELDCEKFERNNVNNGQISHEDPWD